MLETEFLEAEVALFDAFFGPEFLAAVVEELLLYGSQDLIARLDLGFELPQFGLDSLPFAVVLRVFEVFESASEGRDLGFLRGDFSR